MNAQMFLENFEAIANAPNGVAKLREIILSLAMQGKLVKQNLQDIPASEMLKEIEAEKQRLKTPNSLLKVKAEEMHYALPTGWEWVRFGNIAQHNSGKTLDKMRNTGYPRDYITTSNLYWGAFELDNVRQMLIRDEELQRCTARKGDLLICEGGEAGRAAVWPYDKEVCFQNHVHRARFYYGIDPYYAYRFFEKLNATGEINQYRKGVGISNMSSKILASIPFPLPPTEEQKRIVAKVDELMALCDKLEAQQQERERRFPVLSRACHARFVEAPSLDNLRAIFDEAGSVSTEDLRKTILSLAVQGKLILQDADDEPSQALLKRLEEERYGFAEIHKIRIPILKPINNSVPFFLPPNWLWVRLNALFNVITDGDHQAPPKSEAGIAFLTIGNITTGKLDFRVTHFVSESYYRGLAAFRRPLHGDILYTVVGATYGRPALVDTDRAFCVQRHIAILKPAPSCDLGFLMILLRSPFVYEQASAGTTGTAQPTIPLGALRNFLVPLPPLAEQRRIVAKVNQLMALIDKLEEQQARKAKIAQAFAQAAVSAITGTEIKEPEKMKAPKTELVSRLQTRNTPNAADPAPLTKLLTEHNGELPAKALWQRSGLEIDAFYQQLRTEMANGWIIEPEKAVMKEIEAD